MSRLRILVADDHPGVRALVRDILEPTFEVIGTADNGECLVEMALRLHPEVIVTDICMPIMSGIEAADQLKKSGSCAKIVFLTAYADPDFVRACMEAGASGYLLKPRMQTDLLTAIREALAGRIFLSSTGDYEQ